MAALLLQTVNAANEGTRTLLFILLILAIMLIVAGAVIAIITFAYARREHSALADENVLGE